MRLSHYLSRHRRNLAAEQALRDQYAAFVAAIDPVKALKAVTDAETAIFAAHKTGNQGALDVRLAIYDAAMRTYLSTQTARANIAPQPRLAH